MLEAQVRTEAAPPLRGSTDLDHPIYIGCIEPDHSSGQERCSANTGSVLVFEVSPGDLEEPVGVHEWGIPEVKPRLPMVFMLTVADDSTS